MAPFHSARRRSARQKQRGRAPRIGPTVTILSLGLFQQDGFTVRPDYRRIENFYAEIRRIGAPRLPQPFENRVAVVHLSVRSDHGKIRPERSLALGEVGRFTTRPEPSLEESVQRDDLLPRHL